MNRLQDVLSSLLILFTTTIPFYAQDSPITATGEVWIVGALPLPRLGVSMMDIGNTSLGIYAGVPLIDSSVFSLFVGYDRALGNEQYQPQNAASLHIRVQSTKFKRTAEFIMLGFGTGIPSPDAVMPTRPLVQFSFGESLQLYDRHRMLLMFRLQSFIGDRTMGQLSVGYCYVL